MAFAAACWSARSGSSAAAAVTPLALRCWCLRRWLCLLKRPQPGLQVGDRLVSGRLILLGGGLLSRRRRATELRSIRRSLSIAAGRRIRARRYAGRGGTAQGRPLERLYAAADAIGIAAAIDRHRADPPAALARRRALSAAAADRRGAAFERLRGQSDGAPAGAPAAAVRLAAGRSAARRGRLTAPATRRTPARLRRVPLA